MYEEIIKQAQEQVSAAVQQQHGLDKEKADKAVDIISKNLMDTGKAQLEQKDFSTLREMVSGSNTAADNTVIQKLLPQVTGELVNNGFSPEQSSAVSTTTLVMLFNMFNEKVAEAKKHGIDVASLIEKFAGGGFGSMGALMNMAGMMKGGAGGLMSGLMSKFKK